MAQIYFDWRMHVTTPYFLPWKGCTECTWMCSGKPNTQSTIKNNISSSSCQKTNTNWNQIQSIHQVQLPKCWRIIKRSYKTMLYTLEKNVLTSPKEFDQGLIQKSKFMLVGGLLTVSFICLDLHLFL